LIPGGKLIIECPDFDKAVDEYLKGREERINNIFGLQRFEGDTHFWGYNFKRLKRALEENEYKGAKRSMPQDYHRLEEPCMRVEAYKSINQRITNNADQEWIERIEKRPQTLTIDWRKKHIHTKILSELKKDLFVNKKTISFGCGTGELEAIMGKNGASIVGIDISDMALQIATKHKQEETLENVEFVKASIFDIPFPNDSFDAGYAVEVIEHLEPEELEKAFYEIKRVIKPDGKFLITVPNKSSYYDSGHRQFYTKGTFAKLFDELNLFVEWIDLDERKDNIANMICLKLLLLISNVFKYGSIKKFVL